MAVKFITVSIEIMHNKELNNSQKFILAEIEQLSSLEKGCFASNKHFAELIGITRENVSRNINELVKMGYVTTEIEAGSRNHTRTISLTKIVTPPYQNSNPPLLKRQETKENIQVNKQKNTQERESAFENFWKFYGVKPKKQEAKKLFLSLSEKDYLDMRKNVVKYVNATHNDGTYPSRIHATTYLNHKNKRWLDEVEQITNNGNGKQQQQLTIGQGSY